jgi:hypothetical protein
LLGSAHNDERTHPLPGAQRRDQSEDSSHGETLTEGRVAGCGDAACSESSVTLTMPKTPRLADDPKIALRQLADAVMEQFPGPLRFWPEGVPDAYRTGAVVSLDWVWRITILAGSEAKRVSELNHESAM